MGFVREFVKKKKEEVFFPSNNAIKELNQNWNQFLKLDTYLIYDEKSDFLNVISRGTKHTHMPWYFFLHFRLKSELKSNIGKLNQYNSVLLNYNQTFVNEKKKEYCSIFKSENLLLDDCQQTAIITDDKHNLIVAGAGSGKTEVLITRIAYLVKRKSDCVEPGKILALAFQNKAAKEIKERLKRRYGLDVEIRTFHSLGKKITEDASKMNNISAPKLKEECSEDWKYQNYIQTIFEKELSNDNSLQNDIITFMKHYGEDEIIKNVADFETKEAFYKYQRNLTYTALDGTKVKSEAEREILNFFLMHKLNGNKIKIVYEKPADWMKYNNEQNEVVIPKPDFYFPDFDVYLEHWAIGENGKVPEWFSGGNPTRKYIETMNLKKEKYKLHQKSLVETSHADYKGKDFHIVLSGRFLHALKEKYGTTEHKLTPLTYVELVESVWESAQFVKHMPLNVANFIRTAKTYRLYPDDIKRRLETERWSPKQISFARIANRIFTAYQKELEEGGYNDFSDMINVAVDNLKANPELYQHKYDHILIDEYQDISTQRYEMIKELMNKNEKCKLFCVGDDWQSIMGFAGSNLDFFINFEKYFPHPARTDLTKNYRSTKSIVDVGACIIKNNGDGQIKKETVSNSEETTPIFVYTSRHQKGFKTPYYEQTAKHCIDTIKEYHTKMNYPYDDFMILLRIAKNPKLRNYITEYAKSQEVPISDQADLPNCVHIMSVHKSKGLQARVVMILNLNKDLYGFPCELEDSEIFMPAIKNNDGLREQEERRLFYVAVTRAKEEVIMYTQMCSESEFITEIKDFIKKKELGY
jgi:DNA helicase-4